MTRSTSELRPSVRLEIVVNTMSGEVLSGWWSPSWSPARAHIVSTGGGWHDREWHGERKADGVHVWFSSLGKRYSGPPASIHETNFQDRVRPADIVMPWADLREVILAGATQDRRARYSKAYSAYCDHSVKGLPHPILRPGQRRELGLPEQDTSGPDPENEAHYAEGLRIHRELGAAGFDILKAGCELIIAKEEKQPEQLGLW